MDPLTRGSLFHDVQAEFYRALQARRRAAGHARHACPTPSTTLDGVLDRVAGEYAEKLAPAIERVWRDEIERAAARPGHLGAASWPTTATWVPEYFEFSFGLNDEGRDPRSLHGSRSSSTAGSCCAGRSISSSATPDSTCCA